MYSLSMVHTWISICLIFIPLFSETRNKYDFLAYCESIIIRGVLNVVEFVVA